MRAAALQRFGVPCPRQAEACPPLQRPRKVTTPTALPLSRSPFRAPRSAIRFRRKGVLNSDHLVSLGRIAAGRTNCLTFLREIAAANPDRPDSLKEIGACGPDRPDFLGEMAAVGPASPLPLEEIAPCGLGGSHFLSPNASSKAGCNVSRHFDAFSTFSSSRCTVPPSPSPHHR